MADPTRTRSSVDVADQQARHLRRTWWFLGGSYAVLATVTLTDLVTGGNARLDLALPLLIAVTAIAVVLSQRASQALEQRRRTEVESFARILRALARSVSPDAIVGAIVEELGEASGADHVVVVRRRPESEVLDATLVTMRPGVPSSTTVLPVAALDDRAEPTLREPVAIPVAGRLPARLPATLAVSAAGGPASPWQAGARGPLAAPIDALAVQLADVTAWLPGTEAAGDLEVPRSVRAGAGSVRGVSRRAEERAARVAGQIAARVRPLYGLHNTLAAPLRTDAGTIGAIVLSRRTDGPWSAASRRLLAASAAEASAALNRVHSQRDAEVRASTDALTGLPNRRYFDEFCGLLARRRRAADTVGILMADIDHFKRLNDRYGHPAGDAVLREVARAIAAAVREDDIPARYGGEEFVVLLRNPTSRMAIDIGERVRVAVRSLDLQQLGVPQVTISVGIAVSTAADEPIAALTARADRALYRAKRGGRDRVSVES